MSSTSEVRLARSAGTRPTSTVATSAVARANSATGQSMPASFSRGMSAGLSATRVSSTAAAPATPRRPPAHAMSALSASSCRTRTPRLAPSAARTASSRRRDAARANTRPATLPHAISRTRATAAISSHKVCRAGPKMKSTQRRDDDAEVRQVDAKLVADGLQIRRHLAPRVVDAHARLQSPQSVEHAKLAEQVGARLSGMTGDRLEPRRRGRPGTERRAGRRIPEASRRSLRRAVESLPRAS